VSVSLPLLLLGCPLTMRVLGRIPLGQTGLGSVIHSYPTIADGTGGCAFGNHPCAYFLQIPRPLTSNALSATLPPIHHRALSSIAGYKMKTWKVRKDGVVVGGEAPPSRACVPLTSTAFKASLVPVAVLSAAAAVLGVLLIQWARRR
jgi:hypothetical protein